MELFKLGFLSVSLIDILDIIVVAYVFYKLYQALSGSRAAQMMIGLAVILMVSMLVQFLNMSGMAWLIDNIRTVWVIAFVILFQPELRRILLAMGQSRLARKLFQVEGLRSIDTIAESAFELSKKRYGGLIVIQKESGLKSIIEKGLTLNAKATAELIVSIFNPQSPLHDGAIVLHGETVEAAKCILPLSDNPTVDKRMGTRHLAAMGLSEESDAIVVVVSEETGRVSVAQNGILNRVEDEIMLRGKLNKLLAPTE